jgi:uncharacterized protein (TIGR00730 family)
MSALESGVSADQAGGLGLRRLCVFCGSNAGARPEYVASARRFAAELVARGIGLVYGGSNVGIMREVADTVLAGGGEVLGVIPQALVERERAHRGLTRLHVVQTMHERKALMNELADGFVALPGGLGTLEEIFEAWSWAQLGSHAKPCALLNVAGYYDALLAFLDHAVREQFLRPEHRAMLLVDDDPARLLDRCATYRAPHAPKWITPQQT